MQHLSLKQLLSVQKALGKRIRSLRIKQGWSKQCRFADACGLNRNYFGEVERGQSSLSLATIGLIAKRLRTTISDLFEGIA
jgi:transcriptional regulator with XRE-family HTH domain